MEHLKPASLKKRLARKVACACLAVSGWLFLLIQLLLSAHHDPSDTLIVFNLVLFTEDICT